MPSIKSSDYDREVPPYFAWAIASNATTAALTAGLAANEPLLRWAASGLAPDASLTGLRVVLALLAARALMAPLALMGRMRMYVNLQFVSLARLDAAIAIARVAATWVVAREGGGALALAVPFALGTVLEIVAFLSLGMIRPGDFRFRGMSWAQTWSVLRWPLLIAILTSLRSETLFLFVSWMVPAAVLGVFYFAYQLANQPTALLAGPLQNVLAPISALARGNSTLERAGIERVLAGAMLFVPITTMAAASFFPSAEKMLWNGKWEQASASVYFLCGAATYSTVAALLAGPLVGLQRFKASAAFDLLKLAGVIAGLAAAAVLLRLGEASTLSSLEPVTVLSACASAGIIASSLAQILWVVRAYRIPAADATRHLIFGPALSLLTGVAATSLATSIDNSIGVPNDRIGALWQFLTITATYTVLIALAVRFTAESTLRDTLTVLPSAIADPLRRMLRLD